MAVIFFEAAVITLLSMRQKDYDDCVKRRGEAYAADRRKILKVLGPCLMILTGLALLADTIFY